MNDPDKQAKSKSPQPKPRHRDKDKHSEHHPKGHSSSHGAVSSKPSEGSKSHKSSGSRSPKSSRDHEPSHRRSPRPPEGSRSPKPSRYQEQNVKRSPRPSEGQKSHKAGGSISPKPSRDQRPADRRSPTSTDKQPSGSRSHKSPKSQKPDHSKSHTASEHQKTSRSRSPGPSGGPKTKKTRPSEGHTTAAGQGTRPAEGAAGTRNTGPSESQNLGGGRSNTRGHAQAGGQSPRSGASAPAVVYPQGPSSQLSRQTPRGDDEQQAGTKKRRCIRDPLVIAIVVVTVILLLVAIAIIAVYFSAHSAPQQVNGTTIMATEAAQDTQTTTQDSKSATTITPTTTSTTTAAATTTKSIPKAATSLPSPPSESTTLSTAKSSTTSTKTTSATPTETPTSMPLPKLTVASKFDCALRTSIRDLCWLNHQTLVALQSGKRQLVTLDVAISSGSCHVNVTDLNFDPGRLACSVDGTIYITYQGENKVRQIYNGGNEKELTLAIDSPLSTIAVNRKYIAISSDDNNGINLFTINNRIHNPVQPESRWLPQNNFAYTHLRRENLFLATTGDKNHNLIIYNIVSKVVTSIGESGQTQYKFETPLGVTSVEDYILVCDRRSRLTVWTVDGAHTDTLELEDTMNCAAISVQAYRSSKILLAVSDEVNGVHSVRIYLLATGLI